MAKTTTKSKVIALHLAGQTCDQIASALKITKPYAYQIVWKYKKTPKLLIQPEHLEKAKALIASTKASELSGFPAAPVKNEGTAIQYDNTQKECYKPDAINPGHYKVGGIETADYIEAKQLGYNLGNVVKYVSRAYHKGNPLEDLQKAKWYLERQIDMMRLDTGY